MVFCDYNEFTLTQSVWAYIRVCVCVYVCACGGICYENGGQTVFIVKHFVETDQADDRMAGCDGTSNRYRF